MTQTESDGDEWRPSRLKQLEQYRHRLGYVEEAWKDCIAALDAADEAYEYEVKPLMKTAELRRRVAIERAYAAYERVLTRPG